MGDYYQDKLNEIKQLIKLQDYQKAKFLLDDELRMPYIPQVYENQFNQLDMEVCQALNPQSTHKQYDESQLLDMLSNPDEKALAAINYLRSSNIRNYLDVVKTYLGNNPHYLLRSQLIEILIEQDIHESLLLDYDGLEVEFIPGYVEMPLVSDGAVATIKLLDMWFGNDDPSFLRMCLDSLAKQLYFQLPFNLEEDEAMYVAVAIVQYVYRARNETDLFEKFIVSKQLANYVGYDLLLCKYGV